MLKRATGFAVLAALLYLGAGLGMVGVRRLPFLRQGDGSRLEKRDLPYVVGMVVLDTAAPIMMLQGLRTTGPGTASLLNSFEIAATTFIALLVFGEKVPGRLWRAILLIVAASILLSLQQGEQPGLSRGAVLILLATVCWGMENNCTRMISHKSGAQIVVIKGLGAGLGALAIALVSGERFPAVPYLLAGLALGFVSYGLSILVYVRAQRDLGAAKTSSWYALAPYLGVLLSALLFRDRPGWNFYAALIIMVAATALLIWDTVGLQHTHAHAHIHSHPHAYGGTTHEHPHSHTHSHLHTHGEDPKDHGHGLDAADGSHRHAHP